jgi:CubicO group peptidase (beta-lactamase class C family)
MIMPATSDKKLFNVIVTHSIRFLFITLLALNQWGCATTAPVESVDPTRFWPKQAWSTTEPNEVGMDAKFLEQARNFALQGGGSGYIVRGGYLVFSWGSPNELYDLKSTTKSIGGTALGLAMDDGLVKLADPARKHLPTLGLPPSRNKVNNWLGEISILHLATHTAGFDKPGGYVWLRYEPGTRWVYSDGGTNWLADMLTNVYRQDLKELLFDRVFTPIGIGPQDLTWRNNAYREDTLNGIKRREIGSGIRANVDAMARIGYLYLQRGQWEGRQLIPADFVDTVRRPASATLGLPVNGPEKHGNASNHYGVLWWTNADGTMADVPKDAFWTWGLRQSLIVVIPSLDLVIARAGPRGWEDADGNTGYALIEPFISAVVRSTRRGTGHPAGE